MALNIHTRKGGKVRDPYKTKERYEKWDKSLPDANPVDVPIILEYIADMEDGKNVGGSKGERSYIRLCTIRSRMVTLSRMVSAHQGKSLLTLTFDDLHTLFKEMRTGKIKKGNGQPYMAVADYVKTFKSFWHWHQRKQRRMGIEITDITQDLDTSREKPKFHYLEYEEVKSLADAAKYEYRVLIWFLYDSGMRPTEMHNIRVCDLELNADDIYSCEIREATSKSKFGRKIKLMLCNGLLKEYLVRKNLSGEQFIWNVSATKTGQYIKRLGQRVLNIPDLGCYDLRHSSACYWLPRYKNESALKYRFGWEKSEMITYYTEFLGMNDTISPEDLINSEEKTQLRKELEIQKQQAVLAQEQMSAMQAQLKEHEQLMEEQINELKSLLLKKGGFLEKVLRTK